MQSYGKEIDALLALPAAEYMRAIATLPPAEFLRAIAIDVWRNNPPDQRGLLEDFIERVTGYRQAGASWIVAGR